MRAANKRSLTSYGIPRALLCLRQNRTHYIACSSLLPPSVPWLPVFLLAAVSACATLDEEPSRLGTDDISPQMLIDESPLGAGVDLDKPSQVDVLEITPEMAAFLDEYIGSARNKHARMKRLVFAISGDDNFEVVYDGSTRTAAETFRDQRGNCLSFTNMFIAMARYLEIEAHYQEVDIPPDWSLAGDSFLFSQHINVHLDLGAGKIRVVDFDFYDINAAYDQRVISDQRARAHYFSNIGVDYMLAGSAPLAYANFRQATREDPEFAPAWINLGVLHRSEGLPNYAKAAFKQALEIGQFNLVAMSNLANLYEEEGFSETAEFYRKKVRIHRMRNAYYRYHLAQNAIIDGDYQAAIDHLKYAIRKREEETRFYFLMSVAYTMSGDQQNADAWLAKANELTADEAGRQQQRNKLDRLMSRKQDNP